MTVPKAVKTNEDLCQIPEHIKWLVDTGERITTADNKTVEVWEFRHQPDKKVLSAWAKHFRNHYCSDDEIDELCSGTGMSHTEYLLNIVFPDRDSHLGPSIRAGDFGEILIADLLQYVRNYWVPRTRYNYKAIRDESTKGSDIIGFKFLKQGEFSSGDILAIFEAKAQFSGKKAKHRLQDAINGSITDKIRKADSLNAIKRRFLHVDAEAKQRVERFQDELGNPYREISGAAALFSLAVYDPGIIKTAVTNNHPNQESLILLVIRGDAMMDIVHDLYERAANEA